MSIPPQLIRVKRKRVDDAPVTFLQFDQDSKRHRSGSNWAYQRRESASQSSPSNSKFTQPTIHVSKPEGTPSPGKKRSHESQTTPQQEQLNTEHHEPRRFHVSRSMLAKSSGQGQLSGISKKNRYGPAIFVESRKKKIPKTRRSLAPSQLLPTRLESELQTAEQIPEETTVDQKQLKRPGVANKARALSGTRQEPLARAPLPESLMNRHNEDMDKIANDMNSWVLNELGANLSSMEQDRKPSKFKPKAPAKRYPERHPDLAPPPNQVDIAMSDLSDEEGDDDEWVIEEYIRIPANSVALDVSPADVGILVFNEEEESKLFFGSATDDDDDAAEDDEDENAENHYTADYPEDEVDSDDEYDRHAYLYRHGNNSDEEEYDNEFYEEQDEMILEGDADDDDDARMARIKEFMKRNDAFR